MRASAVAVLTLWILSFQPPSVAGAQLIEGLVNIRFQADVRVFAVMAAINAGGFDIDAAKPGTESGRAGLLGSG